MSAIKDRVRSERGAVFVQVGISAFVLISFSAWVLDYGMLWVARRQAQNAADAGALAGAVSLGYDDFPVPSGLTSQVAIQVASANRVWQQPATALYSSLCPPGVTGNCVRVDVYRNGQNGSTPLPTVFGPLLGVTSQGVRATATALVGNGNATECLKPWAVADQWDDTTPDGVFNRYDAAGNLLPNPDVYTPPDAFQAVSTTVSGDYGGRVIFDLNLPLNSPITGGFVIPLNLPGALTYSQNMTGCNGQRIELNQRVSIHTSLAGSEPDAALQAAWDLDPGADYDFPNSRIVTSCAPTCAPVSPRFLAIVLYDPDDFELMRATNDWSACPGGTPCVKVSNIIGFFVHRLSGGGFGRHGHFLRYPGMTVSTAPTFVDDGSWLVTTMLIR